MCQSIANGGWRCATHEPGNNAMASWASATTGLPLKEARAAFMTLKDEGAGAAAPTRTEVVDFLSTEEFHVRHADILPLSLKTRILKQLQAALARARQHVLPDGPTFHAWRNVTSECWSRAKRKAVATFLLGGLTAASLTGCGGVNANAAQGQAGTATPTVTISAQVTPGPAAAAIHQRTLMTVNDPQFKTSKVTGPGVAFYGPTNANAAYKTAVLFAMNIGVNGPSLTKAGKITAADLAPVKAAMTPAAFADVQKYADKTNAGDAKAELEMFTVMTMNLSKGSGYAYRDGNQPVVSKETFSSADSWDNDGSLSVQFKTTTDYRMMNDQKQPFTAHTKRDVTLSMAHVGDKWFVDGWTVNQTGATFTKD